jgi:hypothetical protein
MIGRRGFVASAGAAVVATFARTRHQAARSTSATVIRPGEIQSGDLVHGMLPGIGFGFNAAVVRAVLASEVTLLDLDPTQHWVWAYVPTGGNGGDPPGFSPPMRYMQAGLAPVSVSALIGLIKAADGTDRDAIAALLPTVTST